MIPTDDGHVIVRFPDVPEAAGIGETEQAALDNALVVLEQVLATYCTDGRAIPSPSEICAAPIVTTEKFSLLGLEVPAS